jgi:hypothetical protein
MFKNNQSSQAFEKKNQITSNKTIGSLRVFEISPRPELL